MTTRAHAEYDLAIRGVRLAITRGDGPQRVLLRWAPVEATVVTEADVEPPADAWLRLPEDDARAIYAALADHFGHSGHDTRALRRDYDDERRRVDRLLDHLTGR